MDGKDIFRKLTFGARFDLKRFHADAEKLKVCRLIYRFSLSMHSGFLKMMLRFIVVIYLDPKSHADLISLGYDPSVYSLFNF